MVKATEKKSVKAKKPVAKKKPAVKKPVAKKAAARKTVTRKVVVKKPAVRKADAKKIVAKKPAAKKAAFKKATAKKPAAKKKAVKTAVLKKATPVAKKAVKKGAATRAINLRLVNEEEIEAAIDSVVDDELEGNEFGDEIIFADDDAELDDEEPGAAKPASAPGGFPEQMRDAALKVLDERQAEDIVSIPLAGRSSLADYVIIASGRAARQVSALADYLRETFMKLGVKHVRIEGMGESNWVLVDAGDVIVHLFRPEVRSYYDVDSIWASKHPK